MHLYGSLDKYKDKLTVHDLFTDESNPQHIFYEEGHKFPRSLPKEGFNQLKEFAKARFIEKNNSDEGFEVDYDSYNFVVKF